MSDVSLFASRAPPGQPCLADDDQLLEMSVADLQTFNTGDDFQHAAFITDENRYLGNNNVGE